MLKAQVFWSMRTAINQDLFTILHQHNPLPAYVQLSHMLLSAGSSQTLLKANGVCKRSSSIAATDSQPLTAKPELVASGQTVSQACQAPSKLSVTVLAQTVGYCIHLELLKG